MRGTVLPHEIQAFVRVRDELSSAGRPFFSLDETAFGRHGAPAHGYSPRNVPLFVTRRAPHRRTTSALVVIDRRGIVRRELRKGSFSTVPFVEFLASTDLPRGAVLLLDNVAFHKTRAVRELAEARGWTLLFTPPYCPWFNPVEGVFSVVKRAWYARSATIEEAFEAATAAHCRAFFEYSFRQTGPRPV